MISLEGWSSTIKLYPLYLRAKSAKDRKIHPQNQLPSCLDKARIQKTEDQKLLTKRYYIPGPLLSDFHPTAKPRQDYPETLNLTGGGGWI